MFTEVVEFLKNTFGGNEYIPLHEPHFIGNEKKYLNECLDSTFVSSVGKYVNLFEKQFCNYTGAGYAVATVNGTAALHLALHVVNVMRGDIVITQPLTFVATCNAISYLGAEPLFVDIDKSTLGMSDDKLAEFLKTETITRKDGFCYHTASGKRISACLPMHTFGNPVKITEIVKICTEYGIPVVEDAAESIGSTYKNQHTGTFGKIGVYSFNGNKTITCGGGGIIASSDENLANLARHLSTQAKVPHPYEFIHDMTGFNYRMPNLNAALACAQLEQIEFFIGKKRELAEAYKQFFKHTAWTFLEEPVETRSNYWLQKILLQSRTERDEFLTYTNEHGVMTRPAWTLMNKLSMYCECISQNLDNAEWIESHLVNIPSSVR